MIFYVLGAILLLVAVWCVVQISIADFRRRIIPDAYLFPLMLIGLIMVVFWPNYPVGVRSAVVGAVFGYLMSVAIGFVFDYFIRRRDPNAVAPIGMGDIKLIGVGGLWLGATGLSYALIVACVVGAIWARVRGQRFVPFAPFFLLGGILSLTVMAFLL